MSSIEQLSKQYNQVQSELSKMVASRQKLETQLQENKIVKEEFDKLKSGTKIYKLIGPVLLPQEQDEANSNVEKRLDFIKREITRVEEKIATEQSKFTQSRDALVKARTEKIQESAKAVKST